MLKASPYQAVFFYLHGLTLIQAWISNCTCKKCWMKWLIYPQPSTVGVCDWINNFNPTRYFACDYMRALELIHANDNNCKNIAQYVHCICDDDAKFTYIPEYFYNNTFNDINVLWQCLLWSQHVGISRHFPNSCIFASLIFSSRTEYECYEGGI